MFSINEKAMKPEIRIIEYKGKTSGFQIEDKTLYKLELVTDSMTKIIHSGFNSLSTKNAALKAANEWKNLLNWDIKVYKEEKVESTVLVNIK